MGNVNCREFCGPKPRDVQADVSDIHVSQIPLECQICGEECTHTRFKDHLDRKHYCVIQQNKHHISLYCLLCEYQSESLEKHGQHLKEHTMPSTLRHSRSRAKSGSKSEKETQEETSKSNTQLRKSVKEISSKQLQALKYSLQKGSDGHNGAIVTYDNQYDGVNYDENMARAELVWLPIFSKHQAKCTSYYLEIIPLEKAIQVRSHLVIN